MRDRKRSFLCLLMCIALVFGQTVSVFADEAPSSEGFKVTIYTTNDIHGTVVEDTGIIGMAKAAGIKASTENALLVDAGDATQGASFATVTQGADVIRMMNAAGYDAMAAGNHEFDYGEERLLANKELADFPILSANVRKNGSPLLEENTVIEVGDYQIAFLGLTTTETATSTNPSQLQGITFADEVETAKEQIAALPDEIDAIVLVCHMGNSDVAVDCTSGMLLDKLTEEERAKVTAVVDGHSHTLEEEAYDGTIPVVQTGTQFKALGVIQLSFDGEGSVSAEGRVMDCEEAMAFELTEEGVAKEQDVAHTLEEIQQEQNSILGEELCMNDTPLWGGYIYYDYAETRIVETNYGDFVTDAFLDSLKSFAAQQNSGLPLVAVENGGGISSTLPYGKVTRGDVLDAFNHGNMVVVQKVTPAELYTALEGGLVTTGQDETGLLLREKVSGSFLQVSGLTYTYDPGAQAGEKVTEVVLDDGTSLDRTDTVSELLLATNNYVATFAGLSTTEKVGELGGEDMIVENYILKMTENAGKPLSVPVTANRIRIANDASPETYEVSIPVLDGTFQGEAQETAPVINRVMHLRVDDGEAAQCVTDAQGYLHLTLQKGPHTLYLEESSNQKPVYVNNYSGSGTFTTKDGYYSLSFVVDPASVKEPSVTPTPAPSTGPTATPAPVPSVSPTATPTPDATATPMPNATEKPGEAGGKKAVKITFSAKTKKVKAGKSVNLKKYLKVTKGSKSGSDTLSWTFTKKKYKKWATLSKKGVLKTKKKAKGKVLQVQAKVKGSSGSGGTAKIKITVR